MDAAAALQRRLFIEPVKDSRIVNLRVEDSDPDRAAVLANALARAYQHSNLDRRTDSTQDAAQWLEDQLVDLKKNLSASELAMHDFKKDNDLIYTTFENKQTITGQKIVAIDETLTRIRTKKAELDARVKNINAARKSEDPSKLMELGVVSSNLFINSLKLEYAKIANEHADAKDRYGPDHPKMVALEERLKVARENLQNEVDTILGASLLEYRELEQTERNLEQMLSEVKKEAFENNKKEMDYKRLAREEENNQRLYDMVLKRMKELDLSALLKTNNIRILDEAKVSRVPIKPSVRKNVTLGAVLGLLAGIGLAFLLEYQDRSVKGHADIEALGLNFLGLVPSIPGGDATHPKERDLYVHSHPKSSIAECCRTIRTNLMFLSPDKPVKTLVVTSAGAQEGKTTTLINMGMVFAQSGNRVLLIDTDMRKPRLHKSFGVSNELGLSTLIMGEGKLDDAIKSTDVPGLFVLPSGPIPPNPAELLHTENFKHLRRALAERVRQGHLRLTSYWCGDGSAGACEPDGWHPSGAEDFEDQPRHGRPGGSIAEGRECPHPRRRLERRRPRRRRNTATTSATTTGTATTTARVRARHRAVELSQVQHHVRHLRLRDCEISGHRIDSALCWPESAAPSRA